MTVSSRIPSLAMIRARGMIFSATLRLNSVQAQRAKCEPQHGVTHFRRQALTDAVCVDTPSDAASSLIGLHAKVHYADLRIMPRRLYDEFPAKALSPTSWRKTPALPLSPDDGCPPAGR
jgi:hypothetical protein